MIWNKFYKHLTILVLVFLGALAFFTKTDARVVGYDVANIGNRGVINDSKGLLLAKNTLFYQYIVTTDKNIDYPNLKKIDGTYYFNTNDIEKGWLFEDYLKEIGLNSSRRILPNRHYLSKGLSSVIGYTSLDYNLATLNPILGLEKSYDEYLSKGYSLSLSLNYDDSLLLDRLLQAAVGRSGAKAGAAVIMNSKNGEIVAYSSWPTFDSNSFVLGISDGEFSELSNAEGFPLQDKVFSSAAVPGSVFKVFTSMAIIPFVGNDFKIYSDGCFNIGGYNFCEYAKRRLGNLDLADALATSSNIYFCKAALQYTNSTSWLEYKKFFDNLPFSKSIDGLKIANNNFPQRSAISDGDICNTVIGQGEVMVSPLFMLNVVNLIVNNGLMVTPHFVKEIRALDGKVVWLAKEVDNQIVDVPKDVINIVKNGMLKVTKSSIGTDRNVLGRLPIDVWAKTGTAEAYYKGVNIPNGWAIGFFELGGETYSFVVFLNHGKGGWYATPVIKDYILCKIDGC